jgi:hypothetical protein
MVQYRPDGLVARVPIPTPFLRIGICCALAFAVYVAVRSMDTRGDTRMYPVPSDHAQVRLVRFQLSLEAMRYVSEHEIRLSDVHTGYLKCGLRTGLARPFDDKRAWPHV